MDDAVVDPAWLQNCKHAPQELDRHHVHGALREVLGRTFDGSRLANAVASLLGAFPGMSHRGHGDVRAASVMLLADAQARR